MSDKAKYVYTLKEDHLLYGKKGYRFNGDQYDVIPKEHKDLFEVFDPRNKKSIFDIPTGNIIASDPISVTNSYYDEEESADVDFDEEYNEEYGEEEDLNFF